MKDHKRTGGFLLLPLVFAICTIALLGHLVLYLVREELERQQEFQRYRQLSCLGASLTKLAARKKAELKDGTHWLATVTLYPEGEQVTPALILDRGARGQVLHTCAVLYWQQRRWRWHKLYLDVPGGVHHDLYQQSAKAGYSREGSRLPPLDREMYEKSGLFTVETTKKALEGGLNGGLYAEKTKDIVFPRATTIDGNGAFYTLGNIIIGDYTTFSGKIWLLTRGHIIIGKNVALDNAFLYGEESVSLGDNSEVCGIIVTQGRLRCGENSRIKPRPAVLQTFITPVWID